MPIKFRSFLTWLIVVTNLVLVGCSSSLNSCSSPIGCAGTDGAICHYLAKQEALIKRLKANHIQVIRIGDNITLVLPSDLFFEQNTPVLNRNYYPVLNQVVIFLRCLEKINIKVAGYTDNQCPSFRNLVLSRQQAQVIANYLQMCGIDARVLYAVGYGEAMPIATNRTSEGRAMNRRIEITLRQITDYYDY